MELNNLIHFIQDKNELINSLQDLNQDVEHTFKECYTYILSPTFKYDPSYRFKIDSVVDFLNDELNMGHWSEVPITTRQAYTAASFIKAMTILVKPDCKEGPLPEVLKCFDMGLLLGAPLNKNTELLTQCASFISQKLYDPEIIDNRKENMKKRKISEEHFVKYGRLNGEIIPTLKCPSVESFNNFNFLPQIPVKLQDCTIDWPACKKWEDVNYLLRVAGDRTVPIEIGSHYADENWTQKLMSLKEFIQKHYLESSNSIGYLAQHNLFDQIPELKDDICIPAYCGLSRDYENTTDPDINAWLGPNGTVSPLHFDPKDNLLTQIYGTKQVLLYSPADTEYLYPHNDKLLFNTAQVNPVHPDLIKYPTFTQAKMYKCLLEAGETLYIPVKWWHHVTALSKSFSVSFWWQ